MALSEKDIVITPNRGQTNDPKIVFSGADASTSAQNITLNVYPTNSGTLSFEGSAGQLLSISNTMSGSIFSVNDVSGIPSIEVFDSGNIRMNHFSGTLMVGDLEYDNDYYSKVKVQGRVDTNMFGGDSGFLVRRANGTMAAKTAVLANERLGFIIGSAYGTTGYTNNAAINFYAAENQSDTVHSTYITFDTAASTGNRYERMRLDKNGALGIGATDPSLFGNNLLVRTAGGSQASIGIWQAAVGSANIGFVASSNVFKIYNTFADGLLANGKGIDIDTNGYVGIGGAPASKFNIKGVDADVCGVRLENTTATTGKTWQVVSINAGEFRISQVGVVDAMIISPTTGNITVAGKLKFSNYVSTDDHIQLYGTGGSADYGIGVESGTIYYRTYTNHRWYINSNANGGTAGVAMSLNANGLSVVGAGTTTSPSFTVRDNRSGTNNANATSLFVNTYGNHSYGAVAEFRTEGAGDRPSIVFSSTNAAHTWSVGYVTGADDAFRISQNHGIRGGGLWGTDRILVQTDGDVVLRNRLRVRHIEGKGWDTMSITDSELYLNYNVDAAVRWGAGGTGYLYRNGDVRAQRNSTAVGTVYFGSGDRYLTYDGSNFSFGGQGVYVGNLNGITPSYIVSGTNDGKSRGISGGTADTFNNNANGSGFYYGENVTGMPNTGWWTWINVACGWGGSDGYGWQLTSSFWSDDFRIRRFQTGTWQSWTQLTHAGNIGSHINNVTAATSLYFNSDHGIRYSSTHWLIPRDASGNLHIKAATGGIYQDADTIYLRAANGTQHARLGSSGLYMVGARWFRNDTAAYGLYNDATGAHFYSEQDGGYTVASASAANVRIQFRYSGYQSTLRGMVYADGNGFGFLGSDSAWAVKVRGASTSGGDLTGPWSVGGTLTAPTFIGALTGNATSASSAVKLDGANAFTNGTDGWFRSNGAAGWYSNTYDVGIYATEAGNVRTYNGANFISAGGVTGTYLTASASTGEVNLNLAYSGQTQSTYFYKNATNQLGYYNTTTGHVFNINYDKTATFEGTVLVKGMVYVGYGGASSSIEMSDSDEGARTIHCNSQRIGFLTQAGGWGSWCYDDGSWESIGNITAYSDERLKTNWRDVPSNFVELLSKVKSGIYDRTDMQKTQVGVSAQSLREVLPDAVTEGNDENKTLGVAYGNAALLASVELAKEVVSLKAEIQELKQIVKGLLNG